MASHKAKPSHPQEGHIFKDAAALEAALGSQEKEVLIAVAGSGVLNEDLALAFLKRRDLPQAALEALAKNGRAMKSRKVKVGVVAHPKAPRHVTLPLMRHMYTFELMQITLTPAVATDLRMAIEDVLVSRVATLTSGERITLAKRGSGRVAAALLQDSDRRIIEAGLNNPYLSDVLVAKSLLHAKPSALLATYVCRHQKWSVRREVQVAALRNEFTPLAYAIRFTERMSREELSDLFRRSGLPEKIQIYLLEMAKKREERRR